MGSLDKALTTPPQVVSWLLGRFSHSSTLADLQEEHPIKEDYWEIIAGKIIFPFTKCHQFCHEI